MSVFKVFVYEGFADLCFCWVEQTTFGVTGSERILKLYSMVKWMGQR